MIDETARESILEIGEHVLELSDRVLANLRLVEVNVKMISDLNDRLAKFEEKS